MAFFYIWETWPCTLTLTTDDESSPLDDYDEIIVSFAQGSRLVELTGNRLIVDDQAGTITLSLTQQETGKFSAGTPEKPQYAKVQVNVYYLDHERDVSAQGSVEIRDNLHKKVMS